MPAGHPTKAWQLSKVFHRLHEAQRPASSCQYGLDVLPFTERDVYSTGGADALSSLLDSCFNTRLLVFTRALSVATKDVAERKRGALPRKAERGS